MIWSEKYRYDPIANAMSRERFFLLRTNLHCVDVGAVNQAEEQTKNRLWRVQPVIDAVRNRCLQLPRDAGNYSIDEQMIPFGGRCDLKVVVKNKPRPAGLKNFVVTTSKGQVPRLQNISRLHFFFFFFFLGLGRLRSSQTGDQLH
ncbi:hypothetical protein O0L34_g16151 [Tuta absoluta]|nr:hypothetical protein O0L34_g16151 [Tuta absoluta]